MQIINIEVKFTTFIFLIAFTLFNIFNFGHGSGIERSFSHSKREESHFFSTNIIQKFENRNDKNNTKIFQNKNTSHPNSFQSPTSSKYFSNVKFIQTKFSLIFSELNPKLLIKRESFFELVQSSTYRLTKGELDHVFLTLDTEKLDEISHQQWDDFRTLFLLPFEACDSDGDYFLDEKEFKKCFEVDPKNKLFAFRRRHKYDLFKKIMSILSNRGDGKINFFHFLFFKRSIYAWVKCGSHEKYISLSSFKCAMEIVVQLNKKYLMHEIYKIALEYQFRDHSLIAPDFVCFLNIAYMTFYFSVLSYPNQQFLLEESAFLRAMHQDRLPMNFEEEEIKLFYEIIDFKNKIDLIDTKDRKVDVMNFRTFCFFLHFHRLFNRYSGKKPSHLAFDELQEMLDNFHMPSKIVNSIDSSITNLPEPDQLESSLIHQTKRLNEGAFFNKFKFLEIDTKITNRIGVWNKLNFDYSVNTDKDLDEKDNFNNVFLQKNSYKNFIKTKRKRNQNKQNKIQHIQTRLKNRAAAEYQRKQDNSLSTHSFFVPSTTNSTYYDTNKNIQNRKIFFSTFVEYKKKYWNKRNFYRAFQLSNLFISFLDNDHYYRVPVNVLLKKIRDAHHTVNPNINNKQMESFKILFSLPLETKIDILGFLAIENFYEKARSISPSQIGKLKELDLKLILNDFGMKFVPDTVIDLGKVGYDNLKRRIYDIHKVSQRIFVNQITAVELKSDQIAIKNNKLKTNSDPSRYFPQPRRRFQSSPFV